MKEQILTYNGNGLVTRQTVEVETPTEDLDLLNMSEEDEQEDPLFAAIVKHVRRQVKPVQE